MKNEEEMTYLWIADRVDPAASEPDKATRVVEVVAKVQGVTAAPVLLDETDSVDEKERQQEEWEGQRNDRREI